MEPAKSILYQPFKKTDDLQPQTIYKVNQLTRVVGKFGDRVRCHMDGFNYDLPNKFNQLLKPYCLKALDYDVIKLNYKGRNDDEYRTIEMELENLPSVGDNLKRAEIMGVADKTAKKSKVEKKQKGSKIWKMFKNEDDEKTDVESEACKICYANKKKIVIVECGHVGCIQCIKMSRPINPYKTNILCCPFCKGGFKKLIKFYDN